VAKSGLPGGDDAVEPLGQDVAFAVAQHRQTGKLGAQVFATGTGPAGGRLDGITAALTGPEALGFADIAAIASELTGRRITRVTISDDE
jgi:uncharacterized protein YbjT (DUF2867 family)